MPTRNIVLTASQAQFIEHLVHSGLYQNASEVLREGLRMVQSKVTEQEAKLLALRDAAQAGIHDIGAGKFTEFESALGLEDHLNAIALKARFKPNSPRAALAPLKTRKHCWSPPPGLET